MEMVEAIVMGCLIVACLAVFGMVLFGVLWLNARDDLNELRVELSDRERVAAAHMVSGRVGR